MVSIDRGLDAPAASGREKELASGRTQRLYFAIWRWHFYAGLYVIPFLLMLATSGLIILWVTAISPEYGDRMAVMPGEKTLTITEQLAAVSAALPGTIDKYVAPIDAAKPALFRVQTDQGAVMVALDPYAGSVIHQRPEAGTWNDWATNLHGKLLTGVDKGWADYLIETAASLGILMVVSGLWMAWPRNGEGFSAMFVPAFRAKGRAFWKSTHRAVGSWVSIVLFFFLVSGLAWAGIWGGTLVQSWSSFPAEKWGAPLSDQTHASQNHTNAKEVPWALELTPLPLSGSTVGVEILPAGTPVVLETVVALGRAIGFQGRMQVTAPGDETGVWTISQDSMSYDSPDPTSDRTVHIDQYTGKVLADVRFADYSAGGKAMAVGGALHEGQLGPVSIALNIAFCLSVIFLSLGSLVMWWIRRPSKAGRLGAPPLPADVPLTGWMLLALIVLSITVPVLGITLVAMLALDQIVLRALPPLKRLVS
jgi:uncharacterized iron-regulated membrane protein